MAEPSITLIVPTYRRADVLGRALRSLAGQTLRDFELLVVDNGDEASVAALVAEFNRSAPVPARYVAEPRLGLHNARHAGVRTASGDVLVFTDDDATFDPDWLAEMRAAFAAHPEMGAAGGPALPAWDVEPPSWLCNFMGAWWPMFAPLSFLDQGPEFRLSPTELFFGVNMAIRPDVLRAARGFNPDSFGDIWLGDGESGLNRKLWSMGAQIGYVPSAVVHHHAPASRMTPAYLRRREANDGAGDMYGRYCSGVPGPVGLLTDAARVAAANLRDWVAAPLFRDRTDARSLRVQMRAARTRAQAAYALRLIGNPRMRALVERTDWLSDPA